MHFRLPPAWKQLLGAIGGMAAATVLYLGIQNATTSTASLSAYLVTPGEHIAESAGEVRINDTTVDTETLQRIARRAQSVAAALEKPAITSAAQDLVQSAMARREEREQAMLQSSMPTYAAASPVTDRYDRLQLRIQRIQTQKTTADGAHAAAPTEDLATVSKPGSNVAPTAIASPDPPTVTEATPVLAPPSHLSDAGPGYFLLILLTICGVLVMRRHSIARILLHQ